MTTHLTDTNLERFQGVEVDAECERCGAQETVSLEKFLRRDPWRCRPCWAQKKRAKERERHARRQERRRQRKASEVEAA